MKSPTTPPLHDRVLMLAGLPYADLLNDFRAIVRHEVAQAHATLPSEASSAEREEMTIEDVMDFFKISKSTVHAWKQQHRIKAYKTGRRVYFLRSELRSALIPQHQPAPTREKRR